MEFSQVDLAATVDESVSKLRATAGRRRSGERLEFAVRNVVGREGDAQAAHGRDVPLQRCRGEKCGVIADAQGIGLLFPVLVIEPQLETVGESVSQCKGKAVAGEVERVVTGVDLRGPIVGILVETHIARGQVDVLPAARDI